MALKASSVENEQGDLRLFCLLWQKLIFTIPHGENWTILGANVLMLFVFSSEDSCQGIMPQFAVEWLSI